MHRMTATRVSRRALVGATLVAAAVTATVPNPVRGVRSAIASPTRRVGGDPHALFREFGYLIERRMEDLKVPGVAVGVVIDGREHAAGFGVTNVEHPLAVDPETLFQLGSIAKTYTGTAVARLVEAGRLDLEAPVRTYLPDFAVADPAVSAEVRLRHLLAHSAGWFGDLFIDTGDGDDALARYVAGMADLAQVAPLGRFFGYNNAAVVAAGRVVEVAAGQPYEAAVRELVLAPLGLDRTVFSAAEAITAAVAVGHGAPEDDPAGDPVVRRPWAIPRGANPAGGVVSSIADLLRYARFHLGDGTATGARVLGAEGLRRMQEPLGPGGAFGTRLLDGVGTTWFLSTVGGARVAFHAGGTNGQQAVLALAPERGFAVGVLTNAESSDALLDEATDWALGRFLGLERPITAAVPRSPERLAGYAGSYELPDGRGNRVDARGGGLLMTRTARGEPVNGPTTLVPIGGDRFRSDEADRGSFVDFERGADGAVGWVRVGGRLAPRVGRGES
jgi:CubicO group peptidase (beta-lactamase class C family)